jgi:hypothetical protein
MHYYLALDIYRVDMSDQTRYLFQSEHFVREEKSRRRHLKRAHEMVLHFLYICG